jgi:hypothetical protein
VEGGGDDEGDDGELQATTSHKSPELCAPRFHRFHHDHLMITHSITRDWTPVREKARLV